MDMLLLQAAPAAKTYDTVYDLALAGGVLMIPIALCSIVALAYVVERRLALLPGRLIPPTFQAGLEQALAQGPEAALQYAEKSPGLVGRIFAAGLRRWRGSRADVERAVEDAAGREVGVLQRKLRPLVIVIALAPLLGLLGTVFGMIEAFQAMAAQKASGRPDVLAGGISKALITTAAGLLVAIPTQVAWYWLRGKVDRFAASVETLFDQTLGRRLDARDVEPQQKAA
jgi:biopolymer transport protein ExbB